MHLEAFYFERTLLKVSLIQLRSFPRFKKKKKKELKISHCSQTLRVRGFWLSRTYKLHQMSQVHLHLRNNTAFYESNCKCTRGYGTMDYFTKSCWVSRANHASPAPYPAEDPKTSLPPLTTHHCCHLLLLFGKDKPCPIYIESSHMNLYHILFFLTTIH